MNVYMEIRLLPGVDIGLNFLWEKVYRQIHIGLVESRTADGESAIGLAFPDHNAVKQQLGSRSRLFAPDRPTLENFNAPKWLNCLTDYLHVTEIRDVPGKVANYKRYIRKQSKSNTERLARRKARRSGISFDEALRQLGNREESFLKAPFIKVLSLSSGHKFRLFVMEEDCDEPINEGFSCYGLSAKSSLPHF